MGQNDSPMGAADFWEHPEQVEKFANRDPDHRLRKLIESYRTPEATRVLDLGCAGGRNTVFLLQKGFDVIGVDSSQAMVSRTKSRVAEIVGQDQAEMRIFVASMADLPFAGEERFDLVLAFGIYHEASTEAELRRSLAETRRVLVRGGLCLVALSAPGTGPLDSPHAPIPGTRYSHRGEHGRTLSLLTATELDQEFLAQGMVPDVATEVVEREDDESVRITINGIYRKRAL